MPKILRLHTLPVDEPVLRATNRAVTFPLSADVKKLIADMKETVKKAPGIGLAAPQVGANLKLAVVHLEEFGLKTFALLNPLIVSRSIKKSIMQEGCLSIPGFFGQVKRPSRVEVEAYSETGKPVLIKGEGLLAKVLQHEIDHVNGVLIADKAEKSKSK